MSLDELIAKEFGVRTRPVINPAASSVGTAAVEVAPNNPNRLGLVFINLSTNVIYLTPDNAPTTARGVRLSPNGGAVAFNYREDFHIVGYAWYAIADGAGSNIHVLSVEEY